MGSVKVTDEKSILNAISVVPKNSATINNGPSNRKKIHIQPGYNILKRTIKKSNQKLANCPNLASRQNLANCQDSHMDSYTGFENTPQKSYDNTFLAQGPPPDSSKKLTFSATKYTFDDKLALCQFMIRRLKENDPDASHPFGVNIWKKAVLEEGLCPGRSPRAVGAQFAYIIRDLHIYIKNKNDLRYLRSKLSQICKNSVLPFWGRRKKRDPQNLHNLSQNFGSFLTTPSFGVEPEVDETDAEQEPDPEMGGGQIFYEPMDFYQNKQIKQEFLEQQGGQENFDEDENQNLASFRKSRNSKSNEDQLNNELEEEDQDEKGESRDQQSGAVQSGGDQYPTSSGAFSFNQSETDTNAGGSREQMLASRDQVLGSRDLPFYSCVTHSDESTGNSTRISLFKHQQQQYPSAALAPPPAACSAPPPPQPMSNSSSLSTNSANVVFSGNDRSGIFAENNDRSGITTFSSDLDKLKSEIVDLKQKLVDEKYAHITQIHKLMKQIEYYQNESLEKQKLAYFYQLKNAELENELIKIKTQSS